MMQIFAKTIPIDNSIAQFRSTFVYDSILTVPVKEKIYYIPVNEFSSSSVIYNDSVSSKLPFLSFSPTYAVRNYQTAYFTNKRQIVQFWSLCS